MQLMKLADKICIPKDAPVAIKTWWGHQYNYGGHNLPPLGLNRVKVTAKTWWGPVPMSPIPISKLIFWCGFLG